MEIAEIQKEITRIEQEQDVKIWYAVESGSRAWGFPSKDSDYDVRFIYTHPQEWYLSVFDQRDVIEYPIDDVLDINGWDLRKALQLLQKSNPSLIEWLYSPIVYKASNALEVEMRELVVQHISLKHLVYHYLSMAKGNFREYLQKENVKLKKYFYVLRPVLACMYIEKYQKNPPILFQDLLTENDLPAPVLQEIQALLDKKLASEELDLAPKNGTLNQFIEEKIAHYEQYATAIAQNEKIEIKELDSLFRKYIAE